MHPCKTPRATLLKLSKRGAPDENNVRHFLLYLVNSDGLFKYFQLEKWEKIRGQNWGNKLLKTSDEFVSGYL